MNNIIKSTKLEGTVLQLGYSKYNKHYAETHFHKKGEFVVSLKEIDIKTYDVKSNLIDVVSSEEEALTLIKKFQRAFKKETGVSLVKIGINMQNYPIWSKKK